MNYAIYAAQESATNLGKAKRVDWKDADATIKFKTNIKETDLVFKSGKVTQFLKKSKSVIVEVPYHPEDEEAPARAKILLDELVGLVKHVIPDVKHISDNTSNTEKILLTTGTFAESDEETY